MPGGMLGQPRYRWYAPEWAVDGSGYAYANPTLGPELLANGAFDADTNWTKAAGWTITGGVAVGTTASGQLVQAALIPGAPALTPIVMTFDVITATGGTLRYHIGGAGGQGYTTPGSKRGSRLGGGNAALGFNVSTNFSGSIDNASAKQVIGNAYAGVEADHVRQVGIRLSSNPDPHTVYLTGWLDNFDNFSEQQNGVQIIVRGIVGAPFQVSLSKIVSEVQTSLVAATTVSFVANALLEIRRPSGNTFQLWYNGSQVGTDATVDDASIIDNSCFAMMTLTDGPRISEFQINGTKVPFRF